MLAIAAGAAGAQTTGWNVAGPANVFDAANWTGGVPTSVLAALINNGGVLDRIAILNASGFGASTVNSEASIAFRDSTVDIESMSVCSGSSFDSAQADLAAQVDVVRSTMNVAGFQGVGTASVFDQGQLSLDLDFNLTDSAMTTGQTRVMSLSVRPTPSIPRST